MTSSRNFLIGFLLILMSYLAGPGKAADFDSRFQEIVHNATDEQLYRFLYALPKGGDLHNHQDGANWLASLWLGQPGDGREKFFEQIWPRLGGLVRNPYVSSELLIESMKHFGEEGVRYIETQNLVFGLGSFFEYKDQDGNSLSLDQVADIYRHRLQQPDAVATGVTVRFQAVVIRFAPTAEQGVGDAYAFVNRHSDLWVGINMAGREDNVKEFPARFLSVYRNMAVKYPP